jgi:hypothetical protein
MTLLELIANVKLYLTAFYGERCLDFCAGCPCCEAWKAYDEYFADPEEDREEIWQEALSKASQ